MTFQTSIFVLAYRKVQLQEGKGGRRGGKEGKDGEREEGKVNEGLL